MGDVTLTLVAFNFLIFKLEKKKTKKRISGKYISIIQFFVNMWAMKMGFGDINNQTK